ncbi:MAG: hypothetical protein KC621_24220 [Myxococcales bacterium]|nr:hypothetical protein [Myxococcales bacterium]
MGPEVLGAEPELSESGDVYAVGVTLFMLLAGRHPFEDTSLLGLFAGHLAGPPPDVRSVRADVPAELAEVVAACLRTEPTRRPSAAEVAATLSAWANAHRVPSLDRLVQRGTFSEPGAA